MTTLLDRPDLADGEALCDGCGRVFGEDELAMCAGSMPAWPKWECDDCRGECGPCRDEARREWLAEHL